MLKFYIVVFILVCCIAGASGQTPGDSTAPRQDTAAKQDAVAITPDSNKLVTVRKPKPVRPRVDSLRLLVIHDSLVRDSQAKASADSARRIIHYAVPATEPITTQQLKLLLRSNSWFNFLGKPAVQLMRVHQPQDYSGLFYLLIGILFYFALVKLLFNRYLNNLFMLFFRVSLRQQQIREQVLQTPLPSLLLNILFFISAGLYLTFLIRYVHLAQKTDFWLLLINCTLALAGIYVLKFLIFKALGWIFNISRATDLYMFIVFLANKILGIFLLPVLIIFAFGDNLVRDIAFTISIAMVFIFLAYRFLVSYGPVRREIKVNAFHFFLYLCAFEIAPLLLIYKVLVTYLEKAF